ncbi:hypothetical protein GIB67_012960, partial [Kingdonia uniflora]
MVLTTAMAVAIDAYCSSGYPILRMEESKNSDEKVDDIEKDGEEKESEEEQPQVAEEDDSEQPIVVVYYTGKKDVQHDNETMVVAEVAKIEIEFFSHEEVVGEAYQSVYLQASVNQTVVVSIEEQTLEVKKIEDEASQTIEVVQTEVVISYEEEDVGEASQTKESKDEVEQNKEEVFEGKDDDDRNSQNKPDPEQVIDVYIKARFNILTHNIVPAQIKKRLCWQMSLPVNILAGLSMSGLIIFPLQKARKICIYDSMVDTNIANAWKKKKLSPGHQLIEDQISTILLKMLIWRDFADHSSPPTGSE